MSTSPSPAAGRPAVPLEACCAAPEERLLDADHAGDLAAVFTALADPTRVRLLAMVAAAPDGTVCACHLPAELGISQPTLSHHLKKLTAAGLVRREQRGRWAHYTAEPARLEAARAFLSGLGPEVTGETPRRHTAAA